MPLASLSPTDRESLPAATYPYDLAVFIGRFQPFHNGHLAVIQRALAEAATVCVLIGSAGAPRTHRDPFTYRERRAMIEESLGADATRVVVRTLEDRVYNEAQWIKDVQDHVSATADLCHIDRRHARITLVGHGKDHTSYYLRMFPQWASIEVPYHHALSATPMREAYFSNIRDLWLADCDGHHPGALPQDRLVPPPVKQFLTDFAATPDYRAIRDEYEYIVRYRAQWAASPYPPTFVTVDACVVQSGHVLLVRRKDRPGKGLWALPGGFLQPEETIEQGMLRELREETGLKVPEPVLRGSIVTRDVFDCPHRSSRGRTVTHGFLLRLRNGRLHPVRGADDAEKARWWPLAEVRRDLMMEDHKDIIDHLTAYL